MSTIKSLITFSPKNRLDLDLDRIPAIAQTLHQDLAGQSVGAVDAHGIGAANAVGARAAQRQRAINFPLHAVQQIQDGVRFIDIIKRILAPPRFSSFSGIKASNA